MPIETPSHSPITGLRRVLNSAKVQAAASGTAAAYVAVRFAAPTLPPDQRAYLWIAFLGGMFWMIREVVNAWTVEDTADKKAAAATPAVQVNTGTQAANVQQPPAPAVDAGEPAAPAVTNAQMVAAINRIARQVKLLDQQLNPPAPEAGSERTPQ